MSESTKNSQKKGKKLWKNERTIAGALAEETTESATYAESYVKESIPFKNGRSSTQSKERTNSRNTTTEDSRSNFGRNRRAAKTVVKTVAAAAVAVAAVTLDAETGLETEESKGASLAAQPGQILGK